MAAVCETTTASSQLPSVTPACASVLRGWSTAAEASRSGVGSSSPVYDKRRRLTSEGVTSSFSLATQRRLNCATVSLGTAAMSLYCVPSPVRLTQSVQAAAFSARRQARGSAVSCSALHRKTGKNAPAADAADAADAATRLSSVPLRSCADTLGATGQAARRLSVHHARHCGSRARRQSVQPPGRAAYPGQAAWLWDDPPRALLRTSHTFHGGRVRHRDSDSKCRRTSDDATCLPVFLARYDCCASLLPLRW